MKKIIIFLIRLFITTYSFSQPPKLLRGYFTRSAGALNDLKEGDTLLLMFAKEPYIGMLNIGEDKTLYERAWVEQTGAKKTKGKVGLNKIGFWEIDENEIVFNLPTRLITFKYIPLEPHSFTQTLIVTSVKSM